MNDPKAPRSTGRDRVHLTADPAVPTPLPRFDSALVYQWPLGWRITVVVAGLVIAALGLLLFSKPSPRLGHADDALFRGVFRTALIAGGLALALAARTRWTFGIDGIASREWWRTRRLAYAEIASCTASYEMRRQSRGPTVYGVRITFRSTQPFDMPLSLFVSEGYPLDRAIVQRLKTLMPRLSARDRDSLELASLKKLPRFE